MKYFYVLILFFLGSVTFSFSQNIESSTRKFIDEAQFTRINKDWNTIATFKSGIGEHVQFFPVEVVDLKTGEIVKALQLDMYIKNPEVYKTAWVGIEEINEFMTFIRDHVIPNLNLKFKNKSSEFLFKANEMTFSYIVNEKEKRITIKLNDYDDLGVKNYTFWTETQVEKIPKLLKVLNVIK